MHPNQCPRAKKVRWIGTLVKSNGRFRSKRFFVRFAVNVIHKVTIRNIQATDFTCRTSQKYMIWQMKSIGKNHNTPLKRNPCPFGQQPACKSERNGTYHAPAIVRSAKLPDEARVCISVDTFCPTKTNINAQIVPQK